MDGVIVIGVSSVVRVSMQDQKSGDKQACRQVRDGSTSDGNEWRKPDMARE